MKRLTAMCVALLATAGIWYAPPAQAALPADAQAWTCNQQEDYAHAWKTMGEGSVTVYDWSLRILTQHCTSPTSYLHDIKELRVRGHIDQGDPDCEEHTLFGWDKYAANVGRLGAKDPGEVEWNCTSDLTWQMTWYYPANDNLYLGEGDRCVGAHVRWIRDGAPDQSDDIPPACF